MAANPNVVDTTKPEAITAVGQRYGRLTVIREAGRRNHRILWEVRCDCGNPKHKIVTGQDLRRGGTRSCGCLLKKHGGSKSREYAIWGAMKQRCTNPNSPYYFLYGGRGIKVCGRWLNSFENFFTDMRPAPSKHSIERINNDGDYEPGNCYWATPEEQHRNTRGNTIVTVNGISGCLIEMCERYGLNYQRVKNLMRKRSAQEVIDDLCSCSQIPRAAEG